MAATLVIVDSVRASLHTIGQQTGRIVFLSRPAMMPLSISVPLVGAFTTGREHSLLELLCLGLMGAFAHVFGFVLNDLMDYPLDRRSPLRSQSPLVTGQVSQTQAWIAVIVQVPLACLLYAQLLKGTPPGLVILGLSMLLSIVYNVLSKRGFLPRLLSELALASAIGLLALSGALVQSQSLSPPTVLFCLALALVLLQVNSSPSGLKDLQTDLDYGARSFAISTGSTVTSDGNLVISRLLRVYSFTLQGLIVISTGGLVIVFQPGWIIGFLAGVLIVLAGLHLGRVLGAATLSEFLATKPLLGGYYNYLAIVLFTFEIMPGLLKVLYILVLMLMISHPIRTAIHMHRHRYRILLENTDTSQSTP